MRYHVDVVRIRENSIQLNGWAIGKTPETKIRFRVTDGKGTPVSFQYVPTRRDDVSQIYFKETVDKELGFDIRFDYERGKTYILEILGEGRRIRVRFNEELIKRRSSVAYKRRQKLRKSSGTIKVILDKISGVAAEEIGKQPRHIQRTHYCKYTQQMTLAASGRSAI